MRKAIAESRIISAIKYGAIQTAEVARASALKVMDTIGITSLLTRLGLRQTEATVAAGQAVTEGVISGERVVQAAASAASLASTIKNAVVAGALAIKTGLVAAAQAANAAAALTANAAMTFGIGTIVAIAAAAAAIGILIAQMSKARSAGDVAMPADGKTRISSGEGEIFELSDNDDVVAAPGAVDALSNAGNNKSVLQQIEVQASMAAQPIVAAIQSLQTSLEGIVTNVQTRRQANVERVEQEPIEVPNETIQPVANPTSTTQTTPVQTTQDNGPLIAELQKQNALLAQILTATSTPMPIQIGSRVISELQSQLTVENSYRGRGV